MLSKAGTGAREGEREAKEKKGDERWTGKGRGRKIERKREMQKGGGAGRRDRKYWIYATPTHNAARTIFVRFSFHAVASRTYGVRQ